jgi:tetratricopeptide (TPR) repeat protein
MTRTSRLRTYIGVYALICGSLLIGAPAIAQDVSDDFTQAAKLFEERAYSEAITKLEAITQAAPDNEPAWYYLGVARLRTDDYEGALEALLKAAALRPGRPGTHLYIGELYERTGAYDEAIRAYQDELRLREGRDVADAFNALGRTYYYSGRYEQALETLGQAVHEDEDYVEAIFYMGSAEHQLENYKRALKHFSKASDILKEYDKLEGRLEAIEEIEDRRELTSQEQRRKQQTEEDLAQKYGKAQDFVIYLGMRPILNIAMGDSADANEEWSRARNAYRHALNPDEGGSLDDPVAHTRVGRTLLREAQQAFNEYGLLYKAIDIIDQAASKVEEAMGYSDTYAPAHECMGEIYAFQAATYISDAARDIESHSYEDALGEFDLALDNDPNYVQALLHRARTHIALQQPENAIDDLEAALDLEPRNPDLYATLASAQDMTEDYEQAVKTAQTGLLLAPDNPAAHNAVGLAYYYLGELGLATEHFTKAIEADPKQHQSYTNLGNAFFQLGAWHRARMQYEKALERIPKPALANTAFQRSYLLYLIGRTCHYTGMYEREIEALAEALTLDAAYLDALSQLADAYIEVGDFRAAETDLNLAIEKAPDRETEARLRVQLGALYEREGRPHEALTAYAAAVAVDENNLEAKEALERLQAG